MSIIISEIEGKKSTQKLGIGTDMACLKLHGIIIYYTNLFYMKHRFRLSDIHIVYKRSQHVYTKENVGARRTAI